MIRNLVLARDIACVMHNGQDTINAAMAALHMYFRDKVYKNKKRMHRHPSLIDDDVVSILKTALLRDEPHLRDVFKITITRDHPDDFVADVHIDVDDVYLHMIDVQPGSWLCH